MNKPACSWPVHSVHECTLYQMYRLPVQSDLVLCGIVLFCFVLCGIVLFRFVLCCVVLYCKELCCVARRSMVQEDAIVVNLASRAAGLFCSTTFGTHKVEEVRPKHHPG